jgi:hypothetical protein
MESGEERLGYGAVKAILLAGLKRQRRLQCSVCGALGELKERKRFLSRHPAKCAAARAERKEFAHQLAQGTRSVDDADRLTHAIAEDLVTKARGRRVGTSSEEARESRFGAKGERK